jgi:hypothetical protein
MGLFSFFKRNQPQTATLNGHSLNGNGLNGNGHIEIPKEVFIEDRDPQEQTVALHSNGEAKGIESIYAFLQADYESKGYNDALTSPDDSYKADNIQLIKMDLQILVQKVNTYYEDMIRELDFHISSRSRAGLIDLVEELKTRKDMVHEHMGKVTQIEKEMETGTGMTQRILLSYQRGFMRGLSALTQSNVMNKKL